MLARVRSWFGKAPRAAAPEKSTSVVGGLVDRKEPPRRGSTELAAAYRTTPYLRMVVGRIASQCASVEWEALAQGSGTGKARRNRTLERAAFRRREKMLRRMRKAGELREYDTHPMLDLLNRGCSALPGRQGLKVTFVHLDVHGEAFWALERNGAGAPVGFWPMPPAWVQETATQASPLYKISINGKVAYLPERDVLWFKDPDPANPYGRGCGVAETLGDEIDTDEYASKYLKTFFYNSALPAGIVSFEGAGEPEQKRVEQQWNDKFRGVWNRARLLFTNSKIDAKILESSFKDQQILDLRKFERDAILQTFGVPPEVAGIIENSNRSTIDSAFYLFALLVMVPRLDIVRDTLQNKLAPQYDERLVVSFESPVPEDREYRLKVATAAPWAQTRAEWRDDLDLESNGPVDDVYVMALGQIERPIRGEMPKPVVTPPPNGDVSTTPEGETASGDGEDMPDEPMMDEGKSAPVVTKDKKLDVDTVLEALRPLRLSKPLEDVMKRYLQEWGNAALTDLGLAPAFDLLNPKIVDYLENLAGEKIGGLVQDTTLEALRSTLSEGVQAGEGIRELANRVSDVFDEAESWRAVTIARTEVVGASNFGTLTAYQQAGIVEKKQWVSTPDDRTRQGPDADHVAMNGQVKPLDEPFDLMPSGQAMYPGGSGIAAQDINERCTLVAVVGEPKSADALLAVWKAYDQGLRPWEDDATDALRRGFKRQRDDIIAALQRA